jgi:hypothetical protein
VQASTTDGICSDSNTHRCNTVQPLGHIHATQCASPYLRNLTFQVLHLPNSSSLRTLPSVRNTRTVINRRSLFNNRRGQEGIGRYYNVMGACCAVLLYQLDRVKRLNSDGRTRRDPWSLLGVGRSCRWGKGDGNCGEVLEYPNTRDGLCDACSKDEFEAGFLFERYPDVQSWCIYISSIKHHHPLKPFRSAFGNGYELRIMIKSERSTTCCDFTTRSSLPLEATPV